MKWEGLEALEAEFDSALKIEKKDEKKKKYEESPEGGDNDNHVEDTSSDSSTLDFTLTALEEAAEAHQDVIDSVTEFQKLTVNKSLDDEDDSLNTTYPNFP